MRNRGSFHGDEAILGLSSIHVSTGRRLGREYHTNHGDINMVVDSVNDDDVSLGSTEEAATNEAVPSNLAVPEFLSVEPSQFQNSTCRRR